MSSAASIDAVVWKGSYARLAFKPEELAFRDEVRAFIRNNLPAELKRKVDAGALAREHPQDLPRAIRRARLPGFGPMEVITDMTKSRKAGFLDYQATPGSAIVGQDFTPVSGSLVFTNNQTSASFTVPVSSASEQNAFIVWQGTPSAAEDWAVAAEAPRVGIW